MAAMPSGRRVVGILLLALVVCGGALRFAQSDTPGHRLVPDEEEYGRLAIGLVERGDYGDPRLGERTRWAPGAPVAFAAADLVLPSPPARQPFEVPAARAVQAIAGTLMILAGFAVAALLAGPWAGVAAAALIAFYPPLIGVVRYQLSEPLCALLVLLGVLALARGRGAHAARWAAGAGALLGLAVLTRADLLVPVLCAGPALWLVVRGGDGRRRGAALAAGALVVIVPWCVFASVNRGRLVPVSGGGPATLVMGTYLPGDGTVFGFKAGHAAEARARFADLRGASAYEIPAGRALDAVAARHPDEPRDSALMTEALGNVRRYALGEPLGYAAMSLRKAARMWSKAFQTRAPGFVAVHLALLAVGLAGTAVGVARREPVAAVLAVVVAVSTLDNMVLVAEPRHNMPLMPALVAVGAAGLAGVIAGTRPGTRRRAREPLRAGGR
jgi:4-amino-4-deoxy-L-arabinose transferase-like glycosyltransferase